MKSISLSIKIHIPVIYHKHPFSEINIIDEFINLKQTESYVKYIADYKLLPLLHSVQNLTNQFESRIKLPISISGISVKLLELYAPYVLDEIRYHYKNGIFEFFVQHWSNSILPFFVQNEQVRQTGLHRKTIEAVFGQLPTVYMADSVFNPAAYSKFIPFPECTTVFTCSNQLTGNHKTDKPSHSKQTFFLINQALSTKLQQAVSDAGTDIKLNHVTPFIRHLRKHSSLVKPLNLAFNPLARNVSSYKKWQTIVALLITETNSSLYSLTEMEELSNYFSIDNNYSEDMFLQFKIPDNWLKNSMQKEAFKQFLTIYKNIKAGKLTYSPDAWEYLQDVNNFFYMSDSFFIREFSTRHFTPFRSPHEAFTSYMNAVSNFWNVSRQNKVPALNTDFLISPAFN
jgi:alpha-amylase